jgi:hypothetical protein
MNDAIAMTMTILLALFAKEFQTTLADLLVCSYVRFAILFKSIQNAVLHFYISFSIDVGTN